VTQAERIIARFGGIGQLASAIGRDVSSIYRWTYARNAASVGTGGLIPLAAVPLVKEAAVRLGIELTAEDWRP
jgi:hypothetical protein